MSGVVVIISIPTEEHEHFLVKKLKRRVTLDIKPEIIRTNSDKVSLEFEDDFGTLCQDVGFVVNTENDSMEKIIKSTFEQLEITNSTWTKTEDQNHYQIIFPIESGDKCEDILAVLKENQIGNKLNSKISVIPCTIHYHGDDVNENEEIKEDSIYLEKDNHTKHSGWNLFVSSVRSRLTVAQVAENVKIKAAMTFDFIMLLLISTTLCALGLVENNNIYMLSSFLISPMMGPVMAGTFGSVIQDKHLQKIGVQNELIGLGIATLVGFCYGALICIFTDKYGTQDWPTYEMYSRGELRSLWVGAIIALLSGAAVALSILSDNIASLVGVAISTSLMPSAVNAGLLWSLGCVYYLKENEAARYKFLTHTDYYSKNSFIELTVLGALSMCLTFINIICIYVAGIVVFKIKEVAPNTSRDHARKVFWNHDIKVARNYNKSIQQGESNNAYQSIMDQISANQKAGTFHRYSTDLSRDVLKPHIKRSEYTWSPCFSDVYDQYKVLTTTKPLNTNASRVLDFPLQRSPTIDLPKSPVDVKGKYRRLSQIFPRGSPKEDALKIIPEKITEKTPLISSITTTEPGGNTYLLSSGKKYTVTPCELDSYIPQKI